MFLKLWVMYIMVVEHLVLITTTSNVHSCSVKILACWGGKGKQSCCMNDFRKYAKLIIWPRLLWLSQAVMTIDAIDSPYTRKWAPHHSLGVSSSLKNLLLSFAWAFFRWQTQKRLKLYSPNKLNTEQYAGTHEYSQCFMVSKSITMLNTGQYAGTHEYLHWFVLTKSLIILKTKQYAGTHEYLQCFVVTKSLTILSTAQYSGTQEYSQCFLVTKSLTFRSYRSN